MTAVIECPDGTTYTQQIGDDFNDLQELKEMLGNEYWIVDIYE